MSGLKVPAVGTLLACLLLNLGAGRAQAQPRVEPNGPDWAFGHPAGEAAVSALGALSLAAFLLPQRASGWAPSSEQQAGEHADVLSDLSGGIFGATVQMAAGHGLESRYYASADVADPGARALRTTLVEIESLVLVGGITEAIKRLSGRCRPRAWQRELGRCNPDHPEHDAFPSGHTSAVAAVAGARLAVALRSQGPSTPRSLAFGMAEAASLVTAALRMMAGAHSWEDVTAGWAIGHAVGGLVSLAHPMTEAPRGAAVEPELSVPSASFHWSVAF